MAIGPRGRMLREELPLIRFKVSGKPDAMPEVPEGMVLVSGLAYYGDVPEDGIEDLKVCSTIGDVLRDILWHELFGGNKELNWYVLDIDAACRVGLVEPGANVLAKAL